MGRIGLLRAFLCLFVGIAAIASVGARAESRTLRSHVSWSDRTVEGVEVDSDGDGSPDAEDNCLATINPDQSDRDGDGVGDACDNCPDDLNAGQEDFDTVGGFSAQKLISSGIDFPASVIAADLNGDGTGDACTPPSIAISLTPSTLWPPDHRMVAVHAEVEALAPSGAVELILVSITSNEPDAAAADDGNASEIIIGAECGTADYDFELRAARSGSGEGRVYTVVYQATTINGSSLSATASATVTVPHDRGRSGSRTTGKRNR